MSIETKHPAYKDHADKWQRMRDVIGGQDAVHAAGVKYLPMLSEQKPQEYQAYKMRAVFFNATARTIDALHGLLFRKPPVIDATGMDEILADITMAGDTAEAFTGKMARECLSVGRVGALVDFPPPKGQPITVGEAQASGQRPFIKLYKAEHILNWKTGRIANKQALTEVRLWETYSEPEGEFDEVVGEQIRRLVLIEGVYVQQLYRQTDAGDWTLIEQLVPQMNGASMPFIPFVILGPDGCTPEVQNPPLIDMADLNLSHYRSTADLEHGAHLTGLPMLFLAGIQLAEGEKVLVGSQAAVTSPDPQADGKWIEFTGQGLGALETRCAQKEQQMAALGARMLAPEKKQAEAMGTVEMRVGHETAMLADIAHVVSQAMTQALEWLRDWSRASGDVSLQVSTDYVVTTLTAPEVTALVAAWQQGAISKNTLFWNLQQGEVIEDGVSFEDEEARIGDEPPVLSNEITMDGVRRTPMPGESGEDGEDGESVSTGSSPSTTEVIVDMQPVADAIKAIPAPQPQAPVDLAPLLEAIKGMQPPVVNITTAPITVEAPQISLPPINVTIEKSGGIKFVEDADGKLIGAETVQ